MIRFVTKLGVVGLLICFGIFYGIDVANTGITRIQGPITSQGTETASQISADTIQKSAANESAKSDVIATPEPIRRTSLVNHLADAAGDILQRTARGGIELIVSIFDGIL